MSFDPLLWAPLVILVGLALIGFCVWRLVVDGRRRLLWGLRTATAVVLTIAMLGPGVPRGTALTEATEADVWLVIDTTSSAMARDYPGDKPRMEGYREDVRKIAEGIPGAKFSVITFDGAARVTMPLTSDGTALETTMRTLRPEITEYSKGSSVTEAGTVLRTSLEAARERTPERARFVFYLGDGEQTNGEPPTPFDVGDLVAGGAVLGYGTPEGGPMVETRPGLQETTEDIKDKDGKQAISTIDEDELRTIAEQLGVPYVHRAGGDIGPALEKVDPGDAVVTADKDTAGWASFVWILSLLMIGLLLLDVFLVSRDVSRLRKGNPAAAGGTS